MYAYVNIMMLQLLQDEISLIADIVCRVYLSMVISPSGSGEWGQRLATRIDDCTAAMREVNRIVSELAIPVNYIEVLNMRHPASLNLSILLYIALYIPLLHFTSIPSSGEVCTR